MRTFNNLPQSRARDSNGQSRGGSFWQRTNNRRRVVHPHRHWQYVWIPLATATVWFGSSFYLIFDLVVPIARTYPIHVKVCFGLCLSSGWPVVGHDM